MKHNLATTCSEVRKKLKPFLEDLLTENEYQSFIAHVESCIGCKEYVSSIGSLSNQLWELGSIKVPSDFASTVLFKLKQTKGGAQTAKSTISKKALFGILIMILTASTLFFGINYIRLRGHSRKTDKMPLVTVQRTEKEAPPSDREAKILFERLKAIAGALGLPKKEEAIEEDAKEKATLEEEPSVEEPSEVSLYSEKTEVPISGAKPLHWHFAYNQEDEKNKLLDALITPDIDVDYGNSGSDIFVFSTSGKELEGLFEEIMLFSIKRAPLRNFSMGATVYPEREHRISFYLEKETSPTADSIHWHIRFALERWSELLNVITEMGGSLDYESEELVIFSFPKTEIKKLKTRIRAIMITVGGDLSEFGRMESKEGRLDTRPIRLSIYFSKK